MKPKPTLGKSIASGIIATAIGILAVTGIHLGNRPGIGGSRPITVNVAAPSVSVAPPSVTVPVRVPLEDLVTAVNRLTDRISPPLVTLASAVDTVEGLEGKQPVLRIHDAAWDGAHTELNAIAKAITKPPPAITLKLDADEHQTIISLNKAVANLNTFLEDGLGGGMTPSGTASTYVMAAGNRRGVFIREFGATGSFAKLERREGVETLRDFRLVPGRLGSRSMNSELPSDLKVGSDYPVAALGRTYRLTVTHTLPVQLLFPPFPVDRLVVIRIDEYSKRGSSLFRTAGARANGRGGLSLR